jgi:uncharacterized membrane protein YhhN
MRIPFLRAGVFGFSFAFGKIHRQKPCGRAVRIDYGPKGRSMENPVLWAALCAAFTLALLFAEKKQSAALRWLFKPAASAAFLGVAVAAGALDSGFGRIILLGLAFCALGDVLLIARSQAAFLAGMGAFALGHVGYIAAFIHGGVAPGGSAAFAFIGMALFSGVFLTRFWPRLDTFKAPVGIYALIISVMVIASFAHYDQVGSRQGLTLAMAALGFAISDVAVARDRFGDQNFANKLWGLPLYYGAQCLFAANV